MKFIQPELWQPKGIFDLEPNAWLALRQLSSTSVIAGPGAGKTEFLAQKAAYLLETGLCPPNKKILAISFKTDAGKNLADRVKERCPDKLSNQFISMTFDAFTKNLVDRFRMALPEQYRPSKGYEIYFPSTRQDRQLIYSFRSNFYNAVGIYNFTQRLQSIEHFIGSVRLGDPNLQWLEEEFLAFWLGQQINHADGISRVSFLLLNRLAEYIIRTNCYVRRAILATYPFVFIDEFQDTTHSQYDFLYSSFGESRVSITSVGDYKQRIMGWAGARGDAFHQFESDFLATRYPLLLNHRSSPELVRIQHVIAHAIDHEVRDVQAIKNRQITGDSALIYISHTLDCETCYLAKQIASDMYSRSLKPRDYCVLVRQKPEDYEQPLSFYLAHHGLSLRNESEKIGKTSLQDLLSEELTCLFSGLIKLGLGKPNAKVWSELSVSVQQLRNISPEDDKAMRRVENKLKNFMAELRSRMKKPYIYENIYLVFELIIDFINLNDLRKAYPKYATGDLLDINLFALKEFFIKCTQAQNAWEDFIDEFDGIYHIPLMTIHKSKGLEFDTTIFMGVDDNAWWSHEPGGVEGLSTFFVALSRAKQRVVFSYCSERGTRFKVSDFYSLLASAGVCEYEI